MRHAGELQHFMGEGNFPHGAMFGECGAARVVRRALADA